MFTSFYIYIVSTLPVFENCIKLSPKICYVKTCKCQCYSFLIFFVFFSYPMPGRIRKCLNLN